MSTRQPTMLDGDTYHKLRSSNPIKYGEWLLTLKNQGLNQRQIADRLATNRQMVGRYLRIGQWPSEVKAALEHHRQEINNTQILGLAMRPLSATELLAEINNLVREPASGGVKPFPNVGGFNEMLTRLDRIEERIGGLELAQAKCDLLPEVQASSRPEGRSEGTAVMGWKEFFHFCVSPAPTALLICITVLTSYLIFQGILFFAAIDQGIGSAIYSAIISEAIPLAAAAIYSFSLKTSHKLASGALLVTTIAGLGLFMHGSLAERISTESEQYRRVSVERDLLVSSIEALSAGLTALPPEFVSKRREVVESVREERVKLMELDRQLDRLQSEGANIKNVALAYSVWIRLAAMLLNAYLLHYFFLLVRKRPAALGAFPNSHS